MKWLFNKALTNPTMESLFRSACAASCNLIWVLTFQFLKEINAEGFLGMKLHCTISSKTFVLQYGMVNCV